MSPHSAVHQGVLFDVNLIENSALEDGLSGWSPVGTCTALSVVEEEPAKVPTETINDVADGYRPSGRYILASGRADEADGLRRPIAAAALIKPRVTYRVAGWIALGGDGATAGDSHAVRVNLRLDDDDGCVVEGGAVCAEPGKWTEIKGAFRLKKSPCAAEVYVQGAPPGVDVKVMDLQVFATDRKARFRKLRKKTDKVRVVTVHRIGLLRLRLVGELDRHGSLAARTTLARSRGSSQQIRIPKVHALNLC